MQPRTFFVRLNKEPRITTRPAAAAAAAVSAVISSRRLDSCCASADPRSMSAVGSLEPALPPYEVCRRNNTVAHMIAAR